MDRNIKKKRQIILEDYKIQFMEITDTLKISKVCVGHLLHECRDMRKLCAKRAPRKLTIKIIHQCFKYIKTMIKLLQAIIIVAALSQ